MAKDKNSFINGGGAGGGKIPPAAKEIIDSLREVVNHKSYTDDEIYAALLDCDMNPNDAVQQLLSQDTFHEVKSKREKRKEAKDSVEPRAPGSNNAVSCGVKVGECTARRTSSTQSNYNDIDSDYLCSYGICFRVSPSQSQVKLDTREIGPTTPSSLYPSTSTAYQAQRSIVHEPSPLNDLIHVDNREQKVGTGEIFSMADFLRACSGKLYGLSEPLHPIFTSEMLHESPITTGQYNHDNERRVIEKQTDTSGSSMLDTSAARDDKTQCTQSYLSGDKAGMYRNCYSDYHQPSQWDNNAKSFVGGATRYVDKNSDNSRGHVYQHEEGVDSRSLLSSPNHSTSMANDVTRSVTSVALELNQLNLGKESVEPLSKDNHLLVFPNDFQTVGAADFPGLSFGTYKCAISSSASVPLASSSLKVGLREESAARVSSSHMWFDTRSTLYRDHEQCVAVNEACNVTADAKNYDSQLTFQPEQIKQANSNATVRHENISMPSVFDSKFKQTYAPPIPTPDPKVIAKLTPEQRCAFLARRAMEMELEYRKPEVPSHNVLSSDWQPSPHATSFTPRTALPQHTPAQANPQLLSSVREAALREAVSKIRYHRTADSYNNMQQQSSADGHVFHEHVKCPPGLKPNPPFFADYSRDNLHSQYNNRNFFSLFQPQQNDNIINSGASWGEYNSHRPDSRAMPGISADTYFSRAGESEILKRHEQQHQAAEQYGGPGYGRYPSFSNMQGQFWETQREKKAFSSRQGEFWETQEEKKPW